MEVTPGPGSKPSPRRRRVALALAWLVALGCSAADPPLEAGTPDAGRDGGSKLDGGGADAGPIGDAGLAARSACDTLNARRCDFLQRCGLLEATLSAHRDCVAYFRATWCGSTRWPALEGAGTVRYDPQAAQTCADGFVSRGCTEWETLPAACASFLSPNSFQTQACYGWEYAECREGVCRGSGCPRTCQGRGGASEPCDQDEDCKMDAGLYCKVTGTQTVVGACTAHQGISKPCDPETRCQQDMFCSSNQMLCDLKRKPGQACVPGACVDTAWCMTTPDGGFCADKKDGGLACTDDSQCKAGLLCETSTGTGTCTTLGPVPDGGACSLRQSCGPGNACVGVSASRLGVCRSPVPPGGRCASSLDCPVHLACVPADGGLSCGARRSGGAPCTLDRDCQAFSRCVGGSCAALPLPDSPCLSGRCMFGTCEPTPDGGSVCGDIGGPGDLCLADEECGSRRCVSGRCLAACAP